VLLVNAGFAAAVLGILRVWLFRDLPLNVTVFCLSAVAGAFVARGVAYPGRFSTHLIPVTVTLTVCALSLLTRRFAPAARRGRSDYEPGHIPSGYSSSGSSV